MNSEEFRRAHEEGVKIISAVLMMMKVYADESGIEKAYTLFSRWTTAYVPSALDQTKRSLNITETNPKAFYTAMDTLERSFGDKWELVEETPDRITHKIHDCAFREACMILGLDPVETCLKVVVPICNTVCAVINPDLEWNILECNPAPKPCVYEIRYRENRA